MDKNIKFEQDILDVLNKYGYKINNVTSLNIILKSTEVPKISIEYYGGFTEENEIKEEVPDWGWSD